MCGLQTHVVVSSPARIKARQDRFEHITAACIRELMPPATEPLQIVLAFGVRMPEVEERPRHRPATDIENETGHPDWNPLDSRFPKVFSER
jgi:hypothetical protein